MLIISLMNNGNVFIYNGFMIILTYSTGRSYNTIQYSVVIYQALVSNYRNIVFAEKTGCVTIIKKTISNFIMIFRSIIVLCGVNNISMECSLIFPTFRLNVGNTIKYSIEYCKSHVILLCI